ncbi:MAG: DsrE family protein [Desulfovibrionales bacterium]
MRCSRKFAGLSIQLVLAVFLFAGTGSFAHAQENDPLFVNITTDDPPRAKMAIHFSKTQQGFGHNLTIFLNDRAASIASTNNSSGFSDHQEMLVGIVENGGTVLVCPMGMAIYGVDREDLLKGLEVGNAKLVRNALFQNNTRTLSW